MPVNTSNFLYKYGTSPNTRAAVSQKNKVMGYSLGGTGFTQIGAVSEFGWDESRTIDPVRGIGYGDQVAELVPSVTEPMSLTLNKTLMYAANLFQVVGYKGGMDGLMRSLKHARWPFDIKQELVFSEIASDEKGDATRLADGATYPVATTGVLALFTYYEGCWFNSWSGSFTQDAAIVAENGSVTVTDIVDGTSQYGEYIDTGLGNGTAGMGYSLRFAGKNNNGEAGSGL